MPDERRGSCRLSNIESVYDYYGNVIELAQAQDIVIEAGKITKIDADHDFAKKLFLPVIQR